MTQPIHASSLRQLTEAQARLGACMLAQPDASARELATMLGLSENTVKTQLRRMGRALGCGGGRAAIVLSLAAGLRQDWPAIINEEEVPTVPALPTADEVLVAVNNPGAFVLRRAERVNDTLMQEPMRDWQRRALEAGPLHPEGARPPRRPIRKLCNGTHTRTECCGPHGHHVAPHRGCILR